MKYYIAIDIGGTQLRAAVYPENGNQPINIRKILTQHPGETPLERLFGLIDSVWLKDETIISIGVAVPGPVDPYAGVIIETPNIRGWTDLPMQKYLQERYHVPVALGNDANLAALAEWRFGAGQGHKHLIYITVSTGIGGGVIVDNHLLLGQRGLAGELGHFTVDPDGPVCGCGKRGHLEALASGPSMARWVEEQIRQGAPSSLKGKSAITARDVSEAASQGDELALAAFQRAGWALGRTIADYLHIFNPSIVIIGGGVSQSGNLLLDPVRESIKEHLMSPHYLDNFTLTTASLGDDVVLMGALALAHQIKTS